MITSLLIFLIQNQYHCWKWRQSQALIAAVTLSRNFCYIPSGPLNTTLKDREHNEKSPLRRPEVTLRVRKLRRGARSLLSRRRRRIKSRTNFNYQPNLCLITHVCGGRQNGKQVQDRSSIVEFLLLPFHTSALRRPASSGPAARNYWTTGRQLGHLGCNLEGY